MQNDAMGKLGMHRFCIPEDGNCMFRAIAAQLGLEQQQAHPQLRREATRWMEENAEHLLAAGLMDDVAEITSTAKAGAWPGQAALTALANRRNINIDIIHGGDSGGIDTQHIVPFYEARAGHQRTLVRLAYLYCGHYDAITNTPNIPNIEYEAWKLTQEEAVANDRMVAASLADTSGELQ
jgi:hypothetical protein